MAARNKPYEQFGPYLLFKKLETDSLGDSWRAGRIDNGQLGPTVALHRLTGGKREAMVAGAQAVTQLLPQLTGTSFVRDQMVGVEGNVPFLAWDYQGGRSLRYIIDRARGNGGAQPNPLPLDQAIVIAEKVCLSLATTNDLRAADGSRLYHGALIPQFIWISDDGEIRVAGQQLGPALIASMSDPKAAAELGRYFSPEHRSSGQAPKNVDVYAMGAVLFLLVTGQEPPDAATASAFVAAVRAAKTMSGAAIPDDIRVILDKSFNLDPSMRYASMTELKQAVSALAHGGKYSATTFNLAFYLSNLLKKEMEAEAVDREKEAKVNVAPYLERPKSGPYEPTPVPSFLTEQPKTRSKAPLAIAAAVILAAIGIGGWMLMKPKAEPVSKVAAAQVVPPPVKPAPQVPEPIQVSGSGQTTTAPATATTGTMDPEAAKKAAFEEAVRRQMQEEMLKMQSAFEANLKKQQARNAPTTAPAPAPAPTPASSPAGSDERPTLTAAQLDQQRREGTTETAAPAPTPVQTQTTAPQPQVAQPVTPAPAAPVVREGDVIGFASLDVAPKALRAISPTYPPVARSQRISATIILTALIDEEGMVRDVKILSGDPRFGLNDSAIRAMRAARFSSPMKDGKRVKTWFPQRFDFKP